MAKAKKLSSGNWRVQVYDYKDDNGKLHYKSFTAPTAKEAEFMAVSYQLKRDYERNHVTLQEAYKRYIEKKHNILSPSTRRGYYASLKNHFTNLMMCDVNDITEDMVQREVDLMAINYSPKTIANQYGLLVSVLGMFRRDFRMHVSLPRKQTPKRYIPTRKEVKLLYDEADEVLRVPIILASQASLRLSEICAVTPESIKNNGVRVNSAIVMDENNVYVRKPPKTDAGNRFSPLSEESVEICRAWTHFGITPLALKARFSRHTTKLGIPTTMHKLRHFWASQLHQNGVPDKVIMQYGGWDDIETLHEIYLHALPEYDLENQQRIVEISKFV